MDNVKHILLVDDEHLGAAPIVDCLEKAGHSIHYVKSAEKAMKLLLSNPSGYNTVIIKSMMLGEDGIELLTKIKGIPEIKNIPVILSTSNSDNANYIEALKAGAYDFIYNPVEEEFFLYIINTAVQTCDGNAEAYAS
jgi:putative two-component system response regulator